MKSFQYRSPSTPFISHHRLRGPRLGALFCTAHGGWGESWLYFRNKYRTPVLSQNSHDSGPLDSRGCGCKWSYATLFPYPHMASVWVRQEFGPTGSPDEPDLLLGVGRKAKRGLLFQLAAGLTGCMWARTARGLTR
ncbi:hypothetical protein VNO77_02892 [Canavalia gladiata]|uniref:Uncharacterized protein n=1 Tax=Canavalia gladiata TaxID=3824 RepID=A0AAN9R3E5_CANGL